MKCKYTNCKEIEELTHENRVLIGKASYHEKCAKKVKGKAATRDLYYERVSNTVVMSILSKIISSIIDDKDVSPEYLYFALRYAINHGYAIKAPMSLYYIIDDTKIKEAYSKFQRKNMAQPKMESDVKKEPKEVTFTIEQTQRSTWNFFGG